MPDNQPCDLVSQCFLLTAPFRGMLLTSQGGPRCLAPTAHQIPVYLMVFSTFLCRAFTAHYLYTPRYCYISPLCFTAQRRAQVHDRSEGWTRLTVRDGEKGPVQMEMVKRRVQTRLDRKRTGLMLDSGVLHTL